MHRPPQTPSLASLECNHLRPFKEVSLGTEMEGCVHRGDDKTDGQMILPFSSSVQFYFESSVNPAVVGGDWALHGVWRRWCASAVNE